MICTHNTYTPLSLSLYIYIYIYIYIYMMVGIFGEQTMGSSLLRMSSHVDPTLDGLILPNRRRAEIKERDWHLREPLHATFTSLNSEEWGHEELWSR